MREIDCVIEKNFFYIDAVCEEEVCVNPKRDNVAEYYLPHLEHTFGHKGDL
jgi:hypothetical protein